MICYNLHHLEREQVKMVSREGQRNKDLAFFALKCFLDFSFYNLVQIRCTIDYKYQPFEELLLSSKALSNTMYNKFVYIEKTACFSIVHNSRQHEECVWLTCHFINTQGFVRHMNWYLGFPVMTSKKSVLVGI